MNFHKSGLTPNNIEIVIIKGNKEESVSLDEFKQATEQNYNTSTYKFNNTLNGSALVSSNINSLSTSSSIIYLTFLRIPKELGNRNYNLYLEDHHNI